MAGSVAAVVNFTICVLCTIFGVTYARRSALQESSAPSSIGSIAEYTWHVTVSNQAPDCFQRNVILVNGSFQPTLDVTQGDFL